VKGNPEGRCEKTSKRDWRDESGDCDGRGSRLSTHY